MTNTSDHNILTKPLFDLPFSLSIGPQQCGLQWLDQYLRFHEQVCLPQGAKEIFYFDRLFDRGPDFYAGYFSPSQHHKLIMEVTSTAFDHEDAPSHVQDLFGQDLQMICLLRHPVARAYALYMKLKKYGICEGTLEEAVEETPQILHGSRYERHVEKWLEYTDLEDIHFVYYEDLVADPYDFTRKICSILDLRYQLPSPDMLDRNHLNMWQRVQRKFGKKHKILNKQNEFLRCEDIPTDDFKWLQSRLGREIKKFEELIGQDILQWKV